MKLPEAVRAFLEAPRFAVLATIREDGSPHLTVVWYGVRGDELIVNTTVPRSKARNIERDPRVSLLVGENGALCPHRRAGPRGRDRCGGRARHPRPRRPLRRSGC